MRRADLADLTAFVAVADNLSFRAAASHIGVTPSALSHTMRQLEERLAVRLLNRTTRSVSLTDAGLRLLDRARPAVEQISRALDDLKGEQGHPFGRLRLYVTHLAGAAVIAPVWARFFTDLSRRPARSPRRRGAGRHRREGVRCRHRSKRLGGRGHDRRSGDGTDESGRGRRAGILRAVGHTAYAR